MKFYFTQHFLEMNAHLVCSVMWWCSIHTGKCHFIMIYIVFEESNHSPKAVEVFCRYEGPDQDK